MDNLQPSTPAEIRQKAEARAFEAPELLLLPSGIRLLVRKPRSIWWIINYESLPTSLAAKVSGQELFQKNEKLEGDDLIKFASFTRKLMTDMILQPKFGTGANELHPTLIDDEDYAALIKFAGGETTAEGRSLEQFCEQPVSPDASADGSTLEHPSEPAA